MIVLGLLLILIALGAAGFAVIASTTTHQAIELTAVGVTISVTPLALYLAGALSVVLLGLGFAMMSGGMRRSLNSRRELRQLRKEQAASDGNRSAEGEGSHRADRSRDAGKDSNASGTDTSSTNSTDTNTSR